MCVFDTIGSGILSGIIRQSQSDNLNHARCLIFMSFSQLIEIFLYRDHDATELAEFSHWGGSLKNK